MLGDDLFKRRVQGKVVTIQCRHCPAEISLDATAEIPTKPSHEIPSAPLHDLFTAPEPPPRVEVMTKPKAATPPRAPSPPKAPRPPSPHESPSPGRAVALSAGMLSVSEQTPKAPPHRAKTPDAPRVKPPVPLTAVRAHDTLIDLSLAAESEPPPSSGGTPSLSSLAAETAPKKPAGKKKGKSDDFLMNLHAAEDNALLAAPTIDLSNLDQAEPPPPAAPKPVGSLAPSQIDLDVEVDVDVDAKAEPSAEKEKPALTPSASVQAAAAPAATKSRAGVVLGILLAASLGAAAVIKLRPAASERVALAHAPEASEPGSIGRGEPLAAAIAVPQANVAPPARAADSAPAAAPPVAQGAAGSLAAPSPASNGAPRAAPSAPSPSAPNPGAASPNAPGEHTDVAKPAAAAPATAAASEPAKATPEPSKAVAKPDNVDAEFDRAAAVSALKAAAAEAANCRKEGDPTGAASVTITFAPSGRVTSATLSGPPFAGTQTGGCIASAMRRAKVPAFSGDRVTVGKTIVIQ